MVGPAAVATSGWACAARFPTLLRRCCPAGSGGGLLPGWGGLASAQGFVSSAPGVGHHPRRRLVRASGGVRWVCCWAALALGRRTAPSSVGTHGGPSCHLVRRRHGLHRHIVRLGRVAASLAALPPAVAWRPRVVLPPPPRRRLAQRTQGGSAPRFTSRRCAGLALPSAGAASGGGGPPPRRPRRVRQGVLKCMRPLTARGGQGPQEGFQVRGGWGGWSVRAPPGLRPRLCS